MELRYVFRVCSTVLTTTMLLSAWAPAASAKLGFDQVTLTGPGLRSPVQLRPDPEDFADVMVVVEHSGFYKQLACQRCASRMTVPWPDDLGPRYVLTYAMPSSFGPNDEVLTRDLVVQYVYPYAEPDPVTFMPPDQQSPGGWKSVGGWFVADQALTRELEVFGARAPRNEGISDPAADQVAGRQFITASTVLVALVAVVILASLARRQRRRGDLDQPRPVTFEARQE